MVKIKKNKVILDYDYKIDIDLKINIDDFIDNTINKALNENIKITGDKYFGDLNIHFNNNKKIYKFDDLLYTGQTLILTYKYDKFYIFVSYRDNRLISIEIKKNVYPNPCMFNFEYGGSNIKIHEYILCKNVKHNSFGPAYIIHKYNKIFKLNSTIYKAYYIFGEFLPKKTFNFYIKKIEDFKNVNFNHLNDITLNKYYNIAKDLNFSSLDLIEQQIFIRKLSGQYNNRFL